VHYTKTSFDSVLERYAGVPVLVTGASGFVGRWVAHFLARAGAELYLPTREPARAKKIFTQYGVKGKLLKLDLLDAPRLERSIAEIAPAVTFNLAGYGVNRSEQSVRLAHEINEVLPERICAAINKTRAADSWQGARIVHVGTAMEYGSVTGDLCEDSDADPTTVYGRSKLAGTKAVVSFCRDTGLAGITGRLFSVYGPGESAPRLLPTLIAAASNRTGQIELTAGVHKRDFVYVEDVAEALLRLGVSMAPAGEIVNVATGCLTTVRSFAKTTSRILGLSENRLSFGALSTRPEEMEHEAVNVSKLIRLTGWRPETTLKQGLIRTARRQGVVEKVQLGEEPREAVCELF
jgi:nucleoside-diphosphate-sugar epimerase